MKQKVIYNTFKIALEFALKSLKRKISIKLGFLVYYQLKNKFSVLL